MFNHSPASILFATAVGLTIAAAPVALAQLPNPGMTIAWVGVVRVLHPTF